MSALIAGTSGLQSFLQLISMLFIFAFVLAITYFVTKWIANYQKGQSCHRNLRIVETIRLTNNKYVQILEAGSEYLVIAVGKDEVRLLTKLSEEQMKVLPTSQTAGTKYEEESFQDVLKKLKEHLPKSRQKNE